MTNMIRDDIRFVGYISFYERKDIIKEKYQKLSKDDKLTYKYYIYSRRYLKEYTCDLIWQFLNDDEFITETILKKECVKYKV